MRYSYRLKNINRRKAIKVILIILTIIFVFVSISSFISHNIRPVIKRMGEVEVRALAISSINNAIHIVIDETIRYEDFVNIEKDNDNNITFVQLNFVKINRLARDLANLSESNISTLKAQTIPIPIGAFTGSEVFAAFGPSVNIRLLPIGSVLCNFISTFDETGINQSRHRLYLELVTTICIVLPLAEVPLDIKMSVLVVENIIIGKVPETYVKALTQLDALDLVP